MGLGLPCVRKDHELVCVDDVVAVAGGRRQLLPSRCSSKARAAISAEDPLPTLSALTGVEQASHLEWDVTCRATVSFRTRSARHARTEPHCLHPHVGGEKVYPLLTHNPFHTIRPAHDVTSIAARRSPLPRAGASESEGEAACATTQVAGPLSFYFHCTRARPS